MRIDLGCAEKENEVLVSSNIAFDCTELIELIMAFGCNRKEFIKTDNVSSLNKLIVDF